MQLLSFNLINSLLAQLFLAFLSYAIQSFDDILLCLDVYVYIISSLVTDKDRFRSVQSLRLQPVPDHKEGDEDEFKAIGT
ncbi:hypothetical protein P5V15_005506 [Pogonomyrmex californicus]